MEKESDPARRSIRSFVRRAGRLTPSQKKALAELWPQFGIDFDSRLLDLDALFARRAPRTLEIGFGNGDTLVQQAAARPLHDFLGIEVHEPGVGHFLLRIRAAGITNLRLIRHDAMEVLAQQIRGSSIDRINLYFPDPWPKKRHHKRRIVSASFLDLCAHALCAGGSLHIATDWDNYAEYIDESLAAHPDFVLADARTHAGDQPLDRPRTKFEQRGLLRGHQIHDWIFICEKQVEPLALSGT
ncbi:MAG TPA: tRNA (guanosine(46)-N7)-methyltransferase TrmB [Woeseiaceae bacterium]|nr:tRNA (guanosine(46)-N7)-methyltransferase TrmB [Woeseiaceae bacterium]